MNLYLRFLRYARPYWPLALAASACLVVSGFLGAYPIQLFKKAIDVAVGDAAGTVMTFYWLALQYALLHVALGGVRLAVRDDHQGTGDQALRWTAPEGGHRTGAVKEPSDLDPGRGHLVGR